MEFGAGGIFIAAPSPAPPKVAAAPSSRAAPETIRPPSGKQEPDFWSAMGFSAGAVNLRDAPGKAKTLANTAYPSQRRAGLAGVAPKPPQQPAAPPSASLPPSVALAIAGNADMAEARKPGVSPGPAAALAVPIKQPLAAVPAAKPEQRQVLSNPKSPAASPSPTAKTPGRKSAKAKAAALKEVPQPTAPAGAPVSPTPTSLGQDERVAVHLVLGGDGGETRDVQALRVALVARDEELSAIQEAMRAEGHLAAQRLQDLMRSLHSLQEELAVAQQQHKAADERARTWESQCKDLESRLASTAEDRTAVQKALKEAHAGLESLEKERRQLQLELSKSKSLLTKKDADVRSALTQQADAAGKRAEELQAALTKAEQELAGLRQELADSEARGIELSSSQDGLEAQLSASEEARRDAEARAASIESELQMALERALGLERDLASAEDSRVRLELEAKQRAAKFAHLQATFKQREEQLLKQVQALEAGPRADPRAAVELAAALRAVDEARQEAAAAAEEREAAVAEIATARSELAGALTRSAELGAAREALQEELARERQAKQDLLTTLEVSSSRSQSEVRALVDRAVRDKEAELLQQLAALQQQLSESTAALERLTGSTQEAQYRAEAAEASKIELTLRVARAEERAAELEEALAMSSARRPSVAVEQQPAEIVPLSSSVSVPEVSREQSGPGGAGLGEETSGRLEEMSALRRENERLLWQVKMLSATVSGQAAAGTGDASGAASMLNIWACMNPRR